jgi:hypothetical protein
MTGHLDLRPSSTSDDRRADPALAEHPLDLIEKIVDQRSASLKA